MERICSFEIWWLSRMSCLQLLPPFKTFLFEIFKRNRERKWFFTSWCPAVLSMPQKYHFFPSVNNNCIFSSSDCAKNQCWDGGNEILKRETLLRKILLGTRFMIKYVLNSNFEIQEIFNAYFTNEFIPLQRVHRRYTGERSH